MTAQIGSLFVFYAFSRAIFHFTSVAHEIKIYIYFIVIAIIHSKNQIGHRVNTCSNLAK